MMAVGYHVEYTILEVFLMRKSSSELESTHEHRISEDMVSVPGADASAETAEVNETGRVEAAGDGNGTGTAQETVAVQNANELQKHADTPTDTETREYQ